MTALLDRVRGASLGARALRSAVLKLTGYGGAQAIRLASNLILTRLLFPEAFGLMALVTVVLVGLSQFSDVGTTTAILRSPRGDDPEFLNTAWTVQVLRGFLLWGVAAALAVPMAALYDQPELAWLLPVAGLSLVIGGFRPTRMDTANRHLVFGRLTAVELGMQVAAVTVGIALAWLTGSVWALVAASLAGPLAEVLLARVLLQGNRDRFAFERDALSELVSFGKWVFLATICGFFFHQADRLLLGRYVGVDTLGIYQIGYFLASFPMLVGGMLSRQVLIPIYREAPPGATAANFAKLRRMRFLLSGGLFGLAALFALSGVWLVDVLYDPRYALAGAILVALACAQMPMLLGMSYVQAPLAAGDSRSFFVFALLRAVFMVGGLIVGLEWAGLLGALIGQAAAFGLIYPASVWLARRADAWDPLHDGAFGALGIAVISLALWANRAELAMLAG